MSCAGVLFQFLEGQLARRSARKSPKQIGEMIVLAHVCYNNRGAAISRPTKNRFRGHALYKHMVAAKIGAMFFGFVLTPDRCFICFLFRRIDGLCVFLNIPLKGSHS